MIKVKGRTLYVDVDDTIIPWKPDETATDYTSLDAYAINFQTIDQIIRHNLCGHAVIVWSAGGEDWAERVIDYTGIRKYVTICVSKPDWYLDDLPASAFMPESKRRDMRPMTSRNREASAQDSLENPREKK